MHAHRLVAVLDAVDAVRREFLLLALLRVPARNRVLAAEKVVLRLRCPVENVPLELVPDCRIGDRDGLDLATLAEHGQPLLSVVEVPELDTLELALADSTLGRRWRPSQSRRSLLARIAFSWSAENVVRSTPRFFGGLIGRAGSPFSRPVSVAHSKKPLSTEMFFARVLGAASPHCSSTNSSRRSVPIGGSKSASSRSAKNRARLSRHDS